MKYSLISISLLVIVFLAACHAGEEPIRRTIPLKAYEKFEKDTSKSQIELTVLKVYPAQYQCYGSEEFANLYIARMPNGQPVYIFERCRRVSDFATDTTGRYIPLIKTRDILNKRQDSATIFVPKDFNIPAGATYMFAEVTISNES